MFTLLLLMSSLEWTAGVNLIVFTLPGRIYTVKYGNKTDSDMINKLQ
jgi:hypothetical protein